MVIEMSSLCELPNENAKKLAKYVINVEDKKPEDKVGEKEYDPHEHCIAKHPTTYWDTLVHLFKGIVGTGILSLPAAFVQSGYLIGCIGVLVTTYFSTYCAYKLVISEKELCRRRRVPALSFQATAEAAVQDGPKITRGFAPFAMHLCIFLLLVGQVSSACVYMIFIASNIKAVTDVYFGVIDVRIMMLYCSIPLLLISCIRRLKFLAPFSTLGSLALLSSCAVVFYYTFDDMPPLSTRKMCGSIQELPQYFGTVFFATGCISLILPLQNEMKNSQQFTAPLGVLNVGSVAVAVLYALFGLFGYLKYGEDVQGSITLNLPSNHILGQLVQGMLAIATLFGTGLSYYVAVTIFLENYLRPFIKKNLIVWEYTFRIALVAMTVLVAELVPNLELLVSLSGVLLHCTLATVLPCVIHILTFSNGISTLRFFILFSQDILIIIFTSVIFVTGMIANVGRIIQLYE